MDFKKILEEMLGNVEGSIGAGLVGMDGIVIDQISHTATFDIMCHPKSAAPPDVGSPGRRITKVAKARCFCSGHRPLAVACPTVGPGAGHLGLGTGDQGVRRANGRRPAAL